MEILKTLIDLFLHLDKHLAAVIQQYGTLTYVFLFAVIFMETGLVVTPFLPGDSTALRGRRLCCTGKSQRLALVWSAGSGRQCLGDSVNYWIGYKIGERANTGEIKFIKKEYHRSHACLL